MTLRQCKNIVLVEFYFEVTIVTRVIDYLRVNFVVITMQAIILNLIFG